MVQMIPDNTVDYTSILIGWPQNKKDILKVALKIKKTLHTIHILRSANYIFVYSRGIVSSTLLMHFEGK